MTYLHAAQVAYISAATDQNGNVVSRQDYDPWGKVRSGANPGPVVQTKLNFTGQRLDNTGLLYYNARYYDPSLARFVSPDSIVPGASSGVGGAGGTVGQQQNSKLTVDFHESGFLSSAAGENALTLQKGFWFQLGGEDQSKADPSGPRNPQALNRYNYVLNNPLRYVDPTGHWLLTANYMAGDSILPRGYTLTFSRNEFKEIIRLLKEGKPWIAAIYGAVGADLGFIAGILMAIAAEKLTEKEIEELQKLYDAGGTLEITSDPGIFLMTGQSAIWYGVSANKADQAKDGANFAEARECPLPICSAPLRPLGGQRHQGGGGDRNRNAR